MAARPEVADRIADWRSVWLSESEGSAPAVSLQYSIILTCIDFGREMIVGHGLLAGLQALKDHF